MTKYEIKKLRQWFCYHEKYSVGLVVASWLLLMGGLVSIDTYWDGGHCVNGMNYVAEPSKCYPGGKEIDLPGLLILTIIPYIVATVLIFTYPFNLLLLWLRRLDIEGEKRPSKRELKFKEREAAIRRREKELELEPYELGGLNEHSLSR